MNLIRMCQCILHIKHFNSLILLIFLRIVNFFTSSFFFLLFINFYHFLIFIYFVFCYFFIFSIGVFDFVKIFLYFFNLLMWKLLLIVLICGSFINLLYLISSKCLLLFIWRLTKTTLSLTITTFCFKLNFWQNLLGHKVHKIASCEEFTFAFHFKGSL